MSYINSQADEKLIPLAKEHYLINKKDYVIAEKRDLSVIVLNNDAAAQISHISLMNELKETTIENFHHKATELSVDLSKGSNQGNWGDYRKSDFNYAFKETVFAANVGVIPQLFEEGNKAYIVNPLSSDSSVYSYGSDHPILEGRYRVGAWELNRIQVEGYDPASDVPIVVDSFAWNEIEKE